MNSFFPSSEEIEDPLKQDFELEYLAIYPDNAHFEQTLEDFCTLFNLIVEEESENSITASGNDFAIQAKSILSSKKDVSSKSVLLKVRTDNEYDLQSAHEMILEQTIDIVFIDVVLLRDSVGEKNTHEAYVMLNELENALRKVVVLRAASLSGSNWWNERILKCLPRQGNQYKYEIYKRNEIEDVEINPKKRQDHHDIFYVDISLLKNIMEDRDNWKDGFSEDLKALQSIERLDLLNRLRRKIAHNRFLSKRNLEDLRQIHGHLMRLCRRGFDIS